MSADENVSVCVATALGPSSRSTLTAPATNSLASSTARPEHHTSAPGGGPGAATPAISATTGRYAAGRARPGKTAPPCQRHRGASRQRRPGHPALAPAPPRPTRAHHLSFRSALMRVPGPIVRASLRPPRIAGYGAAHPVADHHALPRRIGRVFALRADQPRSRCMWHAGSDARSITESERVLPCCPDRSTDARSEGYVLGPGVLATGKRLAAPKAGTGSLVPAAVTAAKAGFR